MSEGNARVTEETIATSAETFGRLNQHPEASANTPWRIGVSSDPNEQCRRVDEDAHAFIYDFAGLRGQGYFAVFDGHAGKKAAEYCGLHFHEHLLENMRKDPSTPIPHLLNATFHSVDTQLSALSAAEGTHSGCTAVTCLLRLEDENGNPVGEGSGVAPHIAAKRTLYTANAGDARAVLCRGGRAIRLSYDHKAGDAKEMQRIEAAGGYIANQRVNGYLAVTRSLGDSQMKQFVVGSPYTTETTLRDDDDFLILACDGLWDVCTDQQAVDTIKDIRDPQEASDKLVQYALGHHSTDNLTVLVVNLRTDSA
ncbi:protein phosphatase 2C [Rhodotorula sp. JG-1b]|nr:protein phosphatase 2C [Rhodotorula sp. JG-1b]